MSAVLAALLMAAAGPALDCPGKTTIEVNKCFAMARDRAKSELDRYRAAARERLHHGVDADDVPAEALWSFDAGERAWDSYVGQQCGAVFDYWRAGTIRVAKTLGCEIDLTRTHTRALWRTWLTYPDSTPPILPDPDKSAHD